MKKFFFLCSVLTICCSAAAFGQTPSDDVPGLDLKLPKPKVMILGIHHLDNPNLDLVKTKHESILTEKKQKEVREVIERLKAFKPTRIAVEFPFGNNKINERYAQYLENKYTLTENEMDQIGFRTARELNHKMVYPIDYRKGMDFDSVFKFAAENGQQKYIERFQKFIEYIGQKTAAEKDLSLLQQLRLENNLSDQDRLHKSYLLVAEVGKDSNYVGADVVMAWYERNLKIAMNVVRIADSADDRIVIIIGNGHVKLLRQFLKDSPSVEVVEVGDYLGSK